MDKNQNEMKSDKLPLKEAIQFWHRAVLDFDDSNYEDSRNNFSQIIDICSRVSYSIGAVHYRNKEYSKAVLNFILSTTKDPHMALSHFGLGLCYAQEGKHNKARQCYEKARKCLRGNPKIDYTQLGLSFSLWECDIIYNMALNLASMTSEHDWAMEILQEALENAKQERQRARINQAINALTNNKLFDPVHIPDDVFRPPPSKVEGLTNVNFLGKSKVISTASVIKKSDKIPGDLQNQSRTGKETPVRDSSQPEQTNTAPKVSVRDGLIVWHEGVLAFEGGDINRALGEWLRIQDPSAKILYNIAICQMQRNDYEGARKTCHGIINKDQHLAIGHSLLGEVHCKQGRFDDAWNSFGKALELLRKKNSIDYSQLGLTHRLYKCEILVNQAYCYQHTERHEWVKKLLDEALDCKKGPRHSAVEIAAKTASKGGQIECCSIPLDVVFKPPKSKIDNLAEQNFLGTSTVVSVLKGADEKAKATSQRQVGTPPRAVSPAPPPMRAVPPAPVPATSGPNHSEDLPPPPSRTVSRGPDTGPPNRQPPTIPIPGSPNSRRPPSRKLPPSTKPNHSADGYEDPLPPRPSATPPRGSPQGSPGVRRRGPPNKSLPPPPTRDPSSASSSISSSISSTPSSSPPLSPSPPAVPRSKTSGGPPKKALPPPPKRQVPRKPLPPSPLSSSPKSGSPGGSPSPVRAGNSGSQKRSQRPQSGIATAGYEPRAEGELTLMEGDLVKIIYQDGDWTFGEVRGKQGKFPSSSVKSHSIKRSEFF